MTPRAVFLTSFVLLIVASTPGGGAQRDAGRSPKPLTVAQVWNMDAVYRDARRGVSFRHPSVWKPGMGFGYFPPALTTWLWPKEVAGFGYEEGGFPRETIVGPYSKTNLEGFGIVYAAVPGTSAPECETRAASFSSQPDAKPVSFGGRSFSVRETADAGMSQSTSGKLYTAYVQSTCYFFETDVEISVPNIDGPGTPALTKAQTDQINAHLLEIMKSVRIAKQ